MLYVPRVLITDKLKSYSVAQRELLPDIVHRQSRHLNNRAENSSSDPTPRAADAVLQVTAASTALLVDSLLHLRPFSTTTPSSDGTQLSDDARLGLQGLARGDVCAKRGVIAFQSALFAQTRPLSINVTMPYTHLSQFVAAAVGGRPEQSGVKVDQPSCPKPATGRQLSPQIAAILCIKPRTQLTARQAIAVDALKT